MVHTGITLQPERAYLDILAPLFGEAEFFEIVPETMWRVVGGEIVPNGYYREFLELARKHATPCVAHGVGLSLGTADPEDIPRQRRWLDRIALDQREFGFLWYTDHLGATILSGSAVTLPIALPMHATAARIVTQRLVALQECVADVGIENSVFYFLLGEWYDRDPRSFSHAFKRYHGSVAPVALDPWAEAELFLRWLKDDAAASEV